MTDTVEAGPAAPVELWLQATQSLSLPPRTRLGTAPATALLRRVLARWAREQDPGAALPANLRTRRQLPRLRRELHRLAPCLTEAARFELPGALGEPLYSGRLADVAADLLLSQPMAPEIELATQPGALPPGGDQVHAILFADPHLITHELYPLCVDACAAATAAAAPIRVIGVHLDWLQGCRATRAITFDADADRFVEHSLAAPVTPDRVLLLRLGDDEGEAHRRAALRFADRCRNPWAASRTLDDKTCVNAAWRDLGLETTRQIRLCTGDVDSARAALATAPEWVLKPQAGSEGRGVAYLAASLPETELCARLRRCWRHGEALLEPRRDGIAWRDPAGVDRSLVFRLLVVSTTGGPRVESGFAVVGPDADTPASLGRGGRSLPVAGVLAGLARRGGDALALESCRLQELLVEAALASAPAFAEIALVGLDLVLDPGGQEGVKVVLIEANPRPAGLIHARRLTDGLPGVSTTLWSPDPRMVAGGQVAAAGTAQPPRRPTHRETVK